MAQSEIDKRIENAAIDVCNSEELNADTYYDEVVSILERYFKPKEIVSNDRQDRQNETGTNTTTNTNGAINIQTWPTKSSTATVRPKESKRTRYTPRRSSDVRSTDGPSSTRSERKDSTTNKSSDS